MALIALASAKGSPGVTTAALALAALWPHEVLLADCDPAGGDVALRMTGPGGQALNPDRGLLSLAAAGRGGLGPRVVAEHSQPLDGGLPAVMGLRSPEQVGGLGTLWSPLSEALGQMPGDVLADCGRIGPQTPQMAVVRAAELVVLVCRPTGSSVAHMRDRLTALVQTLHGQLGVIVVAGAKERAAVDQVWEVVDRLSLPNLRRWHLAFDPGGAAFFDGMGHGNLVRTLLVRTARDVAGDMAESLPRSNVEERPPLRAPVPQRRLEAPNSAIGPRQGPMEHEVPPTPATGAPAPVPPLPASSGVGTDGTSGGRDPVAVGAAVQVPHGADPSAAPNQGPRRGAHTRDVAEDHPSDAPLEERG